MKKGNTQHQSRHLRMILEIVSREAFRLARELFHIRLTDRHTERLIPCPKTSSPLWPSIQLHPPPQPLISSSLAAILLHFLLSLPRSKALDCLHARTHTRHQYRDPGDYISGPQLSPKSIPLLTKSGERRDWSDRLDTMLHRERSETANLTTLPRHLRYPYDDIIVARDLQVATEIKCD